MTRIFIPQDGKLMLKPEMDKPQYGSTPMAHDAYNAHLASRPTYDTTFELVEGTEYELDKDFKLQPQEEAFNGWENITDDRYCTTRYNTRIIAVPLVEIEKVFTINTEELDLLRSFVDFVADSGASFIKSTIAEFWYIRGRRDTPTKDEFIREFLKQKSNV